MKDKELVKYYENQFAMMSMVGWQELIEDLQKIKNNVNNLSLVPDAHNLFFRKGQLDILELLLNRKESCEKVYEEIQNDPSI